MRVYEYALGLLAMTMTVSFAAEPAVGIYFRPLSDAVSYLVKDTRDETDGFTA